MSVKLFISCDEATTICTKSQYKEATFWEKVKLNIHIISCKMCGMYAKQNNKLTEICNRHLHKKECDHKLSEADKEALKKKLSELEK